MSEQVKKVGEWTLVGERTPMHGGRATVLCRCSCGVYKLVDASELARGRSLSCQTCAARRPDRVAKLSAAAAARPRSQRVRSFDGRRRRVIGGRFVAKDAA